MIGQMVVLDHGAERLSVLTAIGAGEDQHFFDEISKVGVGRS